MKKYLYATIVSSSLGLATSAHAIPTLQLGIENGTYDNSTHTILASGNPFNLFAYLIPDTSNTLSDTYRLSIALVPKTGPGGSTLGSFTIDPGTGPIKIINVTADMTYGVPPLETVATQSSDPGDLSDHGIFDTFFYELAFTFAAANQSAQFNTQDYPARNPSNYPGTGMYFHKFVVDTASLDPSVVLHFDLYNTKICTGNGQGNGNGRGNKNGQGNGNSGGQCQVAGDVDISQFAPFSHDAQSIVPPSPPPPPEDVPEPGILWLLASGLLGLRFWARRV